MNEITKLQGAVREETHKVQELNLALQTKEDLLKEMRVRDSVLRKHQERVHKLKEERDNLSQELRHCKDENYQLAMSYARQSEEKNMALMKNRDLQLEVGLVHMSNWEKSLVVPVPWSCATAVGVDHCVWTKADSSFSLPPHSL